ncbi:HAD family hydrolase [Natronobacterium texcoconense]|uniref:Putative hydrolase of the HAD superfamily n=1 Tax=Natronobacterium texcoconense TaxID=1095778 RepID=A0A1H1IND1_NATTX|nr:HAD family hydrolase [Natronobacterium texcoconense]SDR39150.1 putative hydrolase of the HAD superfamily [Natronobacterium texcoconense]
MTSTRAIFFDLDGTLLELRHEYQNIIAETFNAIEGEVQDNWITQYNEEFFKLFKTCEPDPAKQAFASIEPCSEPESLAEELRKRETASCRPQNGVHDDLERLTENYALGVLTNGFPEWQRGKLRKYNLDQYFDTIVTSYEAGAHKPDEAPYRIAEKRLPAETYAMIGDSDADILGAKNAGWTAYRHSGSGFSEIPAELDWG